MSLEIEVTVPSPPTINVSVQPGGAQGPAGAVDPEDLEAAIEDYLTENPPGGGAWGDITGTLASQTDLQAALDAKSGTGHTHTASNVTDFNAAADARVAAGITGKLDASAAPELIRDTMGTALVAGTNVTITPNDGSDTITITATGGISAPEVRHDSDGTYSYMGNAADGTAEGSSGWTVTRITLTSPPVVETGSGTWTGRAGLSYS